MNTVCRIVPIFLRFSFTSLYLQTLQETDQDPCQYSDTTSLLYRQTLVIGCRCDTLQIFFHKNYFENFFPIAFQSYQP